MDARRHSPHRRLDKFDVCESSPGEYRCEVIATNAAGSTSQSSAPVDVSGSPALTSLPPTVRGSAAAGFAGSVYPHGFSATAHFEYGLDPSLRASAGPLYDHRTPDQPVGSDFAGHPLAASVTGLVPNALYHVRLVATNSAGVALGPDQTFRTTNAPKPPAPVLGKTENAAPVSGKVFVLINGRLVPLTAARQIRSGTEVDALHGTLSLTTATGSKKKTQTGRFAAGVQGDAGESRGEQGPGHVDAGQQCIQGRARTPRVRRTKRSMRRRLRARVPRSSSCTRAPTGNSGPVGDTAPLRYWARSGRSPIRATARSPATSPTLCSSTTSSTTRRSSCTPARATWRGSRSNPLAQRASHPTANAAIRMPCEPGSRSRGPRCSRTSSSAVSPVPSWSAAEGFVASSAVDESVGGGSSGRRGTPRSELCRSRAKQFRNGGDRARA